MNSVLAAQVAHTWVSAPHRAQACFTLRLVPGESLQTADATEDGQDSSGSEDEEEEEDDDEADAASDGQIKLGDDVTVEPILIDFPQMVSINHENAE